ASSMEARAIFFFWITIHDAKNTLPYRKAREPGDSEGRQVKSVYAGRKYMNLLERVLTLLRANLKTLVEKADDPEKVLRQLQLDMRNQLVQVKTQVATAIAESRKLQSRAKEKKAEAEIWQRRAEQAIQQDNDAKARDAL